ncbi:MAG: hypothetical protein JRJ84_06975 [Deltaproteobacteria bacterium]|nr:hypothetical protein [Deltaproteobacteria bacterium]
MTLAVRLARALVLVGALSTSGRAGAVTGLEWQLGEQPVRYLITARVQLPELMWFNAEVNVETRVSEFQVDLVTRCISAGEAGKKGWQLICAIEDIALRAAPAASESGRTLLVLDEWDEKLLGATVQLLFNRDGRLRNVDLEGVEASDRRTSQIRETMRLVMTRVYAPLDLQLPKNGDDRDRGTWKQGSSVVLEFPSDVGSMGAAVVRHTVLAVEASVVTIETTGRGTLGSGEMVQVAGQERPANLFEMSLAGRARFDTARGVLLDRDYVVEGRPTASSVSAEGREGYPYVQVAHLELVGEGVEPPPLGANQEIVREPIPTTFGASPPRGE